MFSRKERTRQTTTKRKSITININEPLISRFWQFIYMDRNDSSNWRWTELIFHILRANWYIQTPDVTMSALERCSCVISIEWIAYIQVFFFFSHLILLFCFLFSSHQQGFLKLCGFWRCVAKEFCTNVPPNKIYKWLGWNE